MLLHLCLSPLQAKLSLENNDLATECSGPALAASSLLLPDVTFKEDLLQILLCIDCHHDARRYGRSTSINEPARQAL